MGVLNGLRGGKFNLVVVVVQSVVVLQMVLVLRHLLLRLGLDELRDPFTLERRGGRFATHLCLDFLVVGVHTVDG